MFEVTIRKSVTGNNRTVEQTAGNGELLRTAGDEIPHRSVRHAHAASADNNPAERAALDVEVDVPGNRAGIRARFRTRLDTAVYSPDHRPALVVALDRHALACENKSFFGVRAARDSERRDAGILRKIVDCILSLLLYEAADRQQQLVAVVERQFVRLVSGQENSADRQRAEFVPRGILHRERLVESGGAGCEVVDAVIRRSAERERIISIRPVFDGGKIVDQERGIRISGASSLFADEFCGESGE